MTGPKVELGRHLFYERRLSVNGELSCGGCHEPALAFTDGEPLAIGATGDVHRRNSMSLVNVAYASGLTWVNPLMRDLERQAMVPLFGTEPVELGLKGIEVEIIEGLAGDPLYQGLFAAAWPEDEDPFNLDRVVKSIAAFERTILSGGSAYDRYTTGGELDAMSQEAKDGMALFFSERFECYHCHGTFNFMDSVATQEMAFPTLMYHNTGLYNLDGQGAFPLRDQGLIEHTMQAYDMGMFRAPTLRNITLTAPYMHDGSAPDLDAVLDHYAAGGRTIESGPDAGTGSTSPLKSALVRGFTATEAERAALIAFLEALTDEDSLAAPHLADPFADD
jgi:cytochrome c peroxidase